jgi:hypothetical protein
MPRIGVTVRGSVFAPGEFGLRVKGLTPVRLWGEKDQ